MAQSAVSTALASPAHGSSRPPQVLGFVVQMLGTFIYNELLIVSFLPVRAKIAQQPGMHIVCWVGSHMCSLHAVFCVLAATH